ncbi:protein of unknown function (plasmid) [Cupriavidus taiwanensis]|uniref:Uncharacterized protein n=1 Tax=Cupriavidus taiwanensis TaxID=164546 RepID=A0A375ED03_9BURK|nr:protein of unknown function [Cupriavidus taiwanensis]SOZ72404.1 protein of unknown function [Cupriavidus taiwanensis]SOZ74763.1 protein of unknown function [Cupriavidus taiwanensis]SPA03606.1 protein of unknown function [Cupriavidus taiwanensis]SPA11507.1 protein of unknown function [Cupriavidus taiwanensis]
MGFWGVASSNGDCCPQLVLLGYFPSLLEDVELFVTRSLTRKIDRSCLRLPRRAMLSTSP